MGDPKFNRKLYETPRRPWEKERIAEENKLLKRHGLENNMDSWINQMQA